MDSVDPTAIDPKARPVLTFAQCAVVTNGVAACPADIFTSDPTKAYTRTQSFEGSSLPNAAKNKVAVNVNYTWDFEAGSLAGSLSYFWRDKQYGTIFERDYNLAPDWSQIDARLTWSSADSRYKIIAYGKNLTDDLGYDAGATGTREAGNIFAASGAVTPVIQGITKSYSVTPPRTYGIELQYKF